VSGCRVDDLRRRRALLERLARANRIASVQVFGSVARGDETPSSDVDLLVEPGPYRARRTGMSVSGGSGLWRKSVMIEATSCGCSNTTACEAPGRTQSRPAGSAS
jgi:predicted nucleotidyltransferase